jgi:molybdenum cofactor biosynthesis enzyme MoaA
MQVGEEADEQTTEEYVSVKELERQLKQWRETRARKGTQQSVSDRRMVRVNGQEVVVITKARNKAQG